MFDFLSDFNFDNAFFFTWVIVIGCWVASCHAPSDYDISDEQAASYTKKIIEYEETLSNRVAQARWDKLAREQHEREVQDEKERIAARKQAVNEFVQRELPTVSQTEALIAAEIENFDKRIDDLRTVMLSFKRNPDEDRDFKRITSQRNELAKLHDEVEAKIVDAYLSHLAFLANPNNNENKERLQRACDESIKDVESLAQRFKRLKDGKKGW